MVRRYRVRRGTKTWNWRLMLLSRVLEIVRMLSSSISALKIVYYRLPTRPECWDPGPRCFFVAFLWFFQCIWGSFLEGWIVHWSSIATPGTRKYTIFFKHFSKDWNAFFECDENSDFRVPRVSIWLDCAFFGWFLDVFWWLGLSFLDGPGGHWRLLAPHCPSRNGKTCDFRSLIWRKN